MLPPTLTFVDVETTGGNPVQERITEIGLIRVENGQVVDTLQSLINPLQVIPEFIQQMTGINDSMVRSAPTFEAIKQEVADFFQDSILVAHNARFDYAFLRQEFARLQVPFRVKQLCTARTSKLLFPQEKRHNLSVLIERFNLTCSQRHRAFGDVEILWQLYQIWQRSFGEEQLAKVLQQVMRRPATPQGLPLHLLSNLPASPGVYIMYGDSPAPLYVGKSVNIKDRVASHFSADYTSAKEMKLAQQVKRIEVVPTAGELGALLRESALIKELLPLHNSRLRRHSTLATLRLVETKKGYRQVKVDRNEALTGQDLSTIWGVFASKQAAERQLTKLADTAGLCHSLLGLESTAGPCFAYRLGTCSGACVGKESPQAFNLRLEMALQPLAIEAWPFVGRIGISEFDPSSELSHLHIFDKWCYVGSVNDAAEIDTTISSPPFDMDAYMILRSFLKRKGNNNVIRLD